MKFKSKEAKEAYKKAMELEEFVAAREKQLEKTGESMPDRYIDMLVEATRLRIKADNLEKEYLKNNKNI